ncbi:MAG: MATE family efflux transporter, partial [bacterium]
MLAIMPAMNFGTALSTFVGQNIGANKMKRIKNGLRSTLIMSSITCIFISIGIILFGSNLMALFTNNNEVIKVGKDYLVIVSSFYIIFNIMLVINGLLRGAGDTIIPMFISIFSLWLIRLPLAVFLSGKFEESGIWWSIPIAWTLGTIISYIYFLSGKWKKKTVVAMGVT